MSDERRRFARAILHGWFGGTPDNHIDILRAWESWKAGATEPCGDDLCDCDRLPEILSDMAAREKTHF